LIFSIFLHLTLDTIVGKIEWLHPFTNQAYSLFNVPAIYEFWAYNFVFHWTFLFEIGVIGWAIYMVVKGGRKAGLVGDRPGSAKGAIDGV